MKNCYVLLLLSAFLLFACQEENPIVEEMPTIPTETPEENVLPAGTQVLPATTQRSGDPAKGYECVTNLGDINI